MTRTIIIARDFSRSPAGRNTDDGPFSGQKFREELLIPALKGDERVEVDLRGALGFGSSFLEEAFGGLVRVHHFKPEELHRRMRFQSDLATYVQRIWSYVDEAAKHH